MGKNLRPASRLRGAIAAFVVFSASLVVAVPNPVNAASAKVTICHRTRSVTNPYRRITVSRNAVVRNAGHGDHTGGVFNTTAGYYNTNPKNWGDIIPSNDTDGNPYNGENSFDQNWDAAGKAIFLPAGVNASKCGRMTAKQFYDIQVAANVPADDVIAELNAMDANEDEALLAALSGGVFSASNLSSWAAAIAVTTNAATSIVDGTGSNGTATLNGSLKYANLEAVKWYFELATDSAFASLVRTGETKTYATVNSLTANGTTQAVSVNVTSLSTGNYYFRVVGISDYNTDLEGVLYGETKTFSIGLPYVTTDALPDATVGSAYTGTLNAAGGIGEKTNFRLNSGSLPLNLAITNPGTADSTATVNGTPASGTQGLYTLPIKADDSKTGTANTSAVKDVTLRIKAPQTVTVPTPASKTYGDATFNINATTNVTVDEIGDLGTFTSYTGTSGVCSVSSTGVVTILAAGSCTVTANHSGNGYWLSGSGNVTFTIATKAITLTAANKSKVVNGTDPTPSVAVTSGSLVGSDAVSGATYDWSGNSHSPTSSIPNFAGTFTITPSAATFSPGSASNYNINYATGTLTVTATAASQTIDFPDPSDKTWGDSNFSIDATSKDGGSNTDLQVSFTSLTTGVCTVGTASKTAGVSSVTVTIVAVGTCTIETTQSGGSNGSQTYSAASSVQQSITVSPKPITIKADDKSKNVDGTNPTFTYTLTGALVGSDAISGVTYTHSSSSYTASTTVPNVVGSFTITPSAAVFSSGSASNYTITYQTGTLTVSAAPTTSSSSTSSTSSSSTTVAASSSSTATTAAPTTTQPPKTDPRKTTTDPFANVSVDPKQNKSKTGGTLTLDGDPPMEVLGATSSDPNIEVEITNSGVEYNKPQTWVDEGFGDECWKFEPGGSAYILPAVPTPPSGRQGVYSLAKVKAGSITSTDPNFQVNTLFVDPKPGDRVWPDSNKNGIYDAGGKNGDKDISHVILCVRYLVSGTTSSVTYAPQATSTTSTTTPGAATTSTTVASGTSTSSTSTTVGSSTSSSTSSSSSSTTSSTATSAPSSSSSSSSSSSPATSPSSSTSVPASSASTTSTLPKDAPDDDGDDDNIVIIIKTVDPDEPVPSVVQVTLRLSTGFEDKTIRLAVMPKTFEVKRVVSLSTDEAVTVFAAEVKAAKAKAKKTATNILPATGSESSGTTVLAVWLVLAGVAVRVAGYGLGRRRRIRR